VASLVVADLAVAARMVLKSMASLVAEMVESLVVTTVVFDGEIDGGPGGGWAGGTRDHFGSPARNPASWP
jgi:hypothetical protein